MTTRDVRLVTADEVSAQNPVEGDLYLTIAGDFDLVDGAAAVAQETRVVLRWIEREWYLDRNRGVPYLSALLRKGVSEGTVRALLLVQTRKVPDLARDPEIVPTIDSRTRQASVTLTGRTVDGAAVAVEV